MRHLTSLVAVALVQLAACAGIETEEDQDAEDGSFSGGKSDGADGVPPALIDLKEGSPVALGLLEVVNTSSAETLRDEIGLSTHTTNALVEARKGADGRLLTTDDVRLWTMAELDAVPYTGDFALTRIYEHARANGHITDRRWMLFYSFGTDDDRSKLLIEDTGRGFLQETVNGALSGSEVSITPAMATEMKSQIEYSYLGLGLTECAPATATSQYGKLDGYVVRSGTLTNIPIDIYTIEKNGTEHCKALNGASTADWVRTTLNELVRVPIPQ